MTGPPIHELHFAQEPDVGEVPGPESRRRLERQREIEEGERIIVGVNEFEVEDAEPEMDLESIDEEDEQRQIDGLEQLREERDDEAVEAALDALADAAEGDENVMPHIVDAVKAKATVGEVCNVFRDIFGEYQQGVSV